ncbi:hypothetical protein ACN47E_007499 [Coniothyrium glycines]
MAFNLTPLPRPGLCLIPGYVAQQPETFLMQGKELLSDKASFLISHATQTGEAGTPFLQLREDTKNRITFKTMDGVEVMSILRDPHKWSGKSPEYRAVRADGTEVWYLKLYRGLTRTEYQLQIPGANVQVENKVQGQDKGILLNGVPAATMSRHEMWKHMSRHDIVHVAPGMDILLALGVNWIRADKQKQDAKMIKAAT